MSEHTQQHQQQSDLGWVARWVGLIVSAMVVALLAISCQERHGSGGAHSSAAGENGGMAASTMPADGEAGAAAADANLPDAAALGFSYPAAPRDRKGDEVTAMNVNCV